MAAMRAGAMLGSSGTTRHTAAWMRGTSKSPSSVRLATRLVHASSGVAVSAASSENAAARLPARDWPWKRLSGPVCSSTACARGLPRVSRGRRNAGVAREGGAGLAHLGVAAGKELGEARGVARGGEFVRDLLQRGARLGARGVAPPRRPVAAGGGDGAGIVGGGARGARAECPARCVRVGGAAHS